MTKKQIEPTAPASLLVEALTARRERYVAQRDQLLAQANAAAGAIAELDELIAAMSNAEAESTSAPPL